MKKREHYFKKYADGSGTEIVGNAKQSDINVYLWGRDGELEPGACSGPVIRDVHIIECGVDGKGILNINGTDFPIAAGQCYVLFPNDVVVHTADMFDPRQHDVWIGIKGLKVDLYLKSLGVSSQQPFLDSRAYPFLVDYINRIIREGENGTVGSELRQMAYVNLIFAELMQLYAEIRPEPGLTRDRYVQQAIGFIETHFAQPIEITKIAKDLGLDRSYFFSVFKQKTGMSPQEFLIRFRIKKSCEFLANPHSSVETVAAAVGYNPTNFARAFYKITGMTPTQYRKSMEPSNRQMRA